MMPFLLGSKAFLLFPSFLCLFRLGLAQIIKAMGDGEGYVCSAFFLNAVRPNAQAMMRQVYVLLLFNLHKALNRLNLFF